MCGPHGWLRAMHGRSLVAPLLGMTVLLATPLGAQPQAGRPVSLNFENARVTDVVRSVATMLGLNVVFTDVPDRRISFSTAAPIRPEEIAGVLESILESNNLVLVQKGAVAQVVPADKAPATGQVRVGSEISDPPPLGLITQLVPLQSIRADEGAAALKQVAGPLARIEPVARSNALLITDRGANVARYLQLLRTLDERPQGESGLRTYVVPLRYANAEDLAYALGQSYEVSVASGRGPSLCDRSLSRNLDVFRARFLWGWYSGEFDDLVLFQQRRGVSPVEQFWAFYLTGDDFYRELARDTDP